MMYFHHLNVFCFKKLTSLLTSLFAFRGKTSFDQAGVGAEKVSEVKKEDNEFELYRKRMMLSYKFRPNPLVSLLHDVL